MATLVADIGATHARFQLADKTTLIGQPLVLETLGFAQARQMLKKAIAELGNPALEGAVLALAGPRAPDTGAIQITNTGLAFTPGEVRDTLDCPAFLVNDFFALAHAVPGCEQVVQIGGSQLDRGVKALLGPGTGLGMATLVPTPNATDEGSSRSSGWWVLASEGGHADLAPGSFLEAELWGLLMQSHGHVSWETVLSGVGIKNLYAAVCAVWGSTPENLTAEAISTRGVSMDDPVCHQTLETFCALLGAAAGSLALTVGATGGVYIGGGIVPQIVEFAQTSPLRRRFDERGDLTDYAQNIALWIIIEQTPGLRGALEYFDLVRE
jgi:glucokinase